MSCRLPLVTQVLQDLNIPYTDAQLEQCWLYLNELKLWNKHMNLSGARTLEELEVHLVDALLGRGYIEQLAPNHVIDLGSGAGFPAIPLAIFNDQISWTLVERSHWRVGFLRVVVALLKRQNQVQVLEQAAEQLVLPAQVVTFRAFRPIEAMYTTFQEYLQHGATLVMYKGKRQTLEAELEQFPLGTKQSIHSVTHKAISGERTVCIIEQ